LAYVANEMSNNISAYTINFTTGALTAIPGSPFQAGSGPVSVAVGPSGKFAYVANEFSDNISVYAIDHVTGALTVVSGSPFAAGSAPTSVTVDPSGKFAYVANSGDGTVSAYTINHNTGALTAVPGSPFSAGSGPASVTVDPTGQFAYVANSGDGTVSAYTIDPAAGALTAIPGSPFSAESGPASVTVDPTGKFAYVANSGDSTVSAYTIDPASGALSVIPASPFNAQAFPASVVTAAVNRSPVLVRYAAHLGAGESYINIANTGLNGDPLEGPGYGNDVSTIGNVCVSLYATDATDGQLVSCCSCLVTPNAVVHLGANADLASEVTGLTPASIVVKLIPSVPIGAATVGSCALQAAGLTVAHLTSGVVAWGTTLHPAPAPSTGFATTSTPFIAVEPSAADVASLTGRCAAIIGNGGTYGICPSCKNAGAM